MSIHYAITNDICTLQINDVNYVFNINDIKISESELNSLVDTGVEWHHGEVLSDEFFEEFSQRSSVRRDLVMQIRHFKLDKRTVDIAGILEKVPNERRRKVLASSYLYLLSNEMVRSISYACDVKEDLLESGKFSSLSIKDGVLGVKTRDSDFQLEIAGSNVQTIEDRSYYIGSPLVKTDNAELFLGIVDRKIKKLFLGNSLKELAYTIEEVLPLMRSDNVDAFYHLNDPRSVIPRDVLSFGYIEATLKKMLSEMRIQYLLVVKSSSRGFENYQRIAAYVRQKIPTFHLTFDDTKKPVGRSMVIACPFNLEYSQKSCPVVSENAEKGRNDLEQYRNMAFYDYGLNVKKFDFKALHMKRPPFPGALLEDKIYTLDWTGDLAFYSTSPHRLRGILIAGVTDQGDINMSAGISDVGRFYRSKFFLSMFRNKKLYETVGEGEKVKRLTIFALNKLGNSSAIRKYLREANERFYGVTFYPLGENVKHARPLTQVQIGLKDIISKVTAGDLPSVLTLDMFPTAYWGVREGIVEYGRLTGYIAPLDLGDVTDNHRKYRVTTIQERLGMKDPNQFVIRNHSPDQVLVAENGEVFGDLTQTDPKVFYVPGASPVTDLLDRAGIRRPIRDLNRMVVSKITSVKKGKTRKSAPDKRSVREIGRLPKIIRADIDPKLMQGLQELDKLILQHIYSEPSVTREDVLHNFTPRFTDYDLNDSVDKLIDAGRIIVKGVGTQVLTLAQYSRRSRYRRKNKKVTNRAKPPSEISLH